MRSLWLIGLLVILPCTRLTGAGLATSDNFSVFTPAGPSQAAAQQYAEQVLAHAERYRAEIALAWLGEELPSGVGKTTINVSFSATRDAGLTWAKDDPRRKYHTIYLTTSPERALRHTLAHEMVHMVLATRFPHPNRLPAWLEEGIASKYDEPSSQATRQTIISWFHRTGNWPPITQVLDADNIAASDRESYAVAASLTEYLLFLKNRDTLLEFGRTAKGLGWDAALRKHYGIRDVSRLQADWQAWACATRVAVANGVAVTAATISAD